MAESTDVLSPETVHGKFKEHGISHIVWLPDSETNFLFTLLDTDPDLNMVGVGPVSYTHLTLPPTPYV